MVRPVATTECWQTLCELRRTMLPEGYSALPWWDGDDWRLVTADWLAKRLMEVEGHVQLETELRCVPNSDPPPHITTQKSFYVEISRARDWAELVTDDAKELRVQLEAATGERIAALEGIAEMPRDSAGKEADVARGDVAGSQGATKEDGPKPSSKGDELAVHERAKGAGIDLGLQRLPRGPDRL